MAETPAVKNKMYRGDEYIIAAMIPDPADPLKKKLVRPFDQNEESHSIEADEIEAESKDRTINDYGKVNEAHPALARFIQGTMMLVPALTLLLLPLGAGMGLLKGYRAAFAALWMVIKPAVLVLAMATPVAWAVAAAITGLAVGFAYAYRGPTNKTRKTYAKQIST
ncbi:phage tail protein [Bacillus cereus]